MYLEKTGGRFVVRRITRGDAADVSKEITEGDTLLSVDGVDVHSLSVEGVHDLIVGREGSMVTLSVHTVMGVTKEVRLLRRAAQTSPVLT